MLMLGRQRVRRTRSRKNEGGANAWRAFVKTRRRGPGCGLGRAASHFYSVSAEMIVVMPWRVSGARRIACGLTLAASTHNMPGHSSSPKSDMRLALSSHGFHTTLALECVLSTISRRLRARSSTLTRALLS